MSEAVKEENRTAGAGRNSALDYMKYIAAFLVVAIHISPLQSISENADFILTRILARIAVPYFFMVSGYFVLAESRRSGKRAVSFFRKTLLLYLAAVLLYLPVNLYAGHLKDISAAGFLSDLFFEGTFYHLWYLPAVLLGMALSIVLVRALGEKGAVAAAAALYLLGLPGDSYYGLLKYLPAAKRFYDSVLEIFPHTRNGIFFAPLFLTMGCYIAGLRRAETEKAAKSRTAEAVQNRTAEAVQNRTGLAAGLVVSVGLMLEEGLRLHNADWQRHDSMYLFLPFVMYFFFRLLLSADAGRKGNPAAGCEEQEIWRQAVRRKLWGHSEVFGNMAMFLYIVHPLVLIAVRGVSGVLGITALCVDNTLVCYVLVSVISAVGAAVLTGIYGMCKKKADAEAAHAFPELTKGRAWLVVERDSLLQNVRILRDILPKETRLMAVVKADAYGHGAAAVAKILYRAGVRAFAVATLGEGIRLRKAGVEGKILILGYTAPEYAPYLKKYHLVQTIVDGTHAKKLNDRGVAIRAHIKLDTGMHRLGEDCEDLEGLLRIFAYPYLRIEGIFSHLCTSDGDAREAVLYTKRQIACFEEAVAALRQRGIGELETHLQSSYGVLNYPGLRCTYARVGIAMYGCYSQISDRTREEPDLKPVLSLKARVALVRALKKDERVGYGCAYTAPCDMRIAVVTIGYGDGYPRNLSDRGSVLIRGKRAPIIGRICMDQLTADVSDIDGVQQGDVATLIGRDGGERITAEEVAGLAGTITNELLSRMGQRLERSIV